MNTLFQKIVPVSVYDEYAEGPSIAVIKLDEALIKRILQLAKAIKKLKATYIGILLRL